jgi:transcriptional regulator with XRE-family HTH domain
MEKTIFCYEYSELRKWLISMRHQKKLTQRDVGQLLDIPHSWVGKVEQGERRLDLVEYVRLCNVLNIDPHEGLTVVTMCMKDCK